MRFEHDPEGLRLPIKLDTATNGEYAPIPLAPVHHHARQLAFESAGAHAKKLGIDRRSFMVSACGAVSSLLGHARRSDPQYSVRNPSFPHAHARAWCVQMPVACRSEAFR